MNNTDGYVQSVGSERANRKVFMWILVGVAILLAVAQEAQPRVIPVYDQHSVGKALVSEKYNNHAFGYCVQPDEYAQKVSQFFDENLK
jgi:hypothetical protein